MLLSNLFLYGRKQDIRIEGNCFTEIADHLTAREDEEIIDASNKAILPSFCNLHTHAAMMFLRGIGEDKELMSWLNDDIWPREAKITPEQMYHLSRFALLEMIKTGTTCFCDMYFFTNETIKAVEEMGIRGALTYTCMDLFKPEATKKARIAAETFLATPAPSRRVLKGLSCHAIYTTSQELFQFCHNLTKQNKTFFHTHSSESNTEMEGCLKEHHCQPIELLHRWGVIDEHTILAHCLHLNSNEIKLLANSGATIAHCPASAFKLNSGQFSLQECLDCGVNIAIGTDGASSNNSLSMMSEMKLAALSAKNRANSPLAGKVNDIFQMATKNGFKALGIKAGKIAVGYLADFILVDLDQTFLQPNFNLLSNMIYAADSSCITDLCCDGKFVMKNRQVHNEAEIIREFKRVCEELI